jgi:hypothetical protein
MPSIFSSWKPSAWPTRTACDPSLIDRSRGPSAQSRSLPDRPDTAESPLRIEFTTSFDQRSPHRLVVTFELSALASACATASARGVTRPCTSPTRNTVWFGPPIGTVRLM